MFPAILSESLGHRPRADSSPDHPTSSKGHHLAIFIDIQASSLENLLRPDTLLGQVQCILHSHDFGKACKIDDLASANLLAFGDEYMQAEQAEKAVTAVSSLSTTRM